MLTIPLVTFGFAIAFRLLGLNTNDGAIVGLGFSGIVAIRVGLGLTKGTLGEAFREGRRLNDAMGAVNILPPLLASLGIIFTASKIGDLIAAGIHKIIPGQNLFLLIVATLCGDGAVHDGDGKLLRCLSGDRCRRVGAVDRQTLRREPGAGGNHYANRGFNRHLDDTDGRQL